MITVLDTFSGIGGFSLAAHRAGFEVVAHCEIEPFPQAVLKYHFPEIPIFNDIRTLTKDKFYEITGRKSVDVICGGSPCQGFSVAGLQRGFGDNRSSLFSEQLRVARELGAKFFVWENVPGALSSNQGRDFARVLSELTRWNLDARKWGGAGFVRARTESDYSVTYRILDTRFFGIPQRRRRIYLVASLGSTPRPEVLFEREGVCRNPTQSGEARKDIAAFANGGIGAYNQSHNAATLLIGGDIKGGGGTLIASSVAATLDTSYAKQYGCDNQHVDAGCPNFVIYENNRQDSRIRESGNVTPTLTAKMGTGGGNTPICVHASQTPICSTEHAHALGVESKQAVCIATKQMSQNVCVDCANPLCASDFKEPQAVCIAENVINRQAKNGGNGVGAQEEVSYTLNATGVHGVANNLLVRRLTPLECERLQGFPDNWTRIPYRGKSAENCPDSPRYKACGNAITVAVGEWVLKRLAKEIQK